MNDFDVVVVGSGPGGAVTARTCAEAGLRVLVLEEGPAVEQGSIAPFSLDQLRSQYRSEGLTVALGRPAVAYTEARCVGGGSEVNSGLYHRTPLGVLDRWRRTHGLDYLDPATLLPIQQGIEDRLAVQNLGDVPLSSASMVLARGAARLGWSGLDVPRWARVTTCGDGTRVQRASMTRTYLADAVSAGAEVRPDCRVVRVAIDRNRATGALYVDPDGRTRKVSGDRVVVSAGAIHTPALLMRSGLSLPGLGRDLAVHPTVKAVARVPGHVNDPEDVATFQVKEFDPWLSLGASASGPAMLALQLADNWPEFGSALGAWSELGSFYAAITSRGRGRVRVLRGRRDPLVTYALTASDLAALRSGLARLTHLLLAAGATEVMPSFADAPVVRRSSDVPTAVAALSRASASVMTVHLMGTARMGRDPRKSVTDPVGRVHGVSGLLVNDASLLPDAPGVNPQGTVMMLAQLNASEMVR